MTEPTKITAAPAVIYDALINIEQLLNDNRLLSLTDQHTLDEMFMRVLRKVGKVHPDLKLSAKWELRNSVSL